MRIVFLLLLALSFTTATAANIPTKNFNSYPSGIFKKTRSGDIVQYDNQGKKIGIYKRVNGKYVKVK